MNLNGCIYGCNPYMPETKPVNPNYHSDQLCGMKVGYAYVPFQHAGQLYCDTDALKYGTIFPELNKPIDIYGKEFCDCSEKGREQ